MSNISNLKIVTEFGELIYKQVSDLNLSFTRIVDDFTDVSNKFGDFSYEFNLPIVKENSQIFGSPETIGSKNFFIKNRNIGCQVYNNNQLILDGLINLEGLTKTTYKCKFYSKFKQLIDTLNSSTTYGDKKTLRDIQFPVVADWHYESSIISHILANYKNSDETFYQFPLNFYSTMYCQESYYSGHTDNLGHTFESDRDDQNFYWMINNIGSDYNQVFIHQLPPAVYIVSIVNQILSDAGWKLGGQFFNDENIKKIILLYAGDEDIYDQATQIYSGNTYITLQIAKFLPDISQSDFLKGIINYFNLYFKIDTTNNIIEFETYDTYFRNTDDIDPYDITSKVDIGSPNFNIGYFLSNNPSILFKPANNQNIFGDNQVMTGATDTVLNTFWTNTSNKAYNQVFNRVEFIEQSNLNLNNYVSTVTKLDIPFSEPTIKKHFVYNVHDINDVDQSVTWHYVYLPLLSKQTPTDNNSVKFNKKSEDTFLFNNESSIKYQGTGSLMYYYGLPETTFVDRVGKPALSDFLYFCMVTGSTTFNVPIPIVSPFQLQNYRNAIEDWLNNDAVNNLEDRRTIVASYLQSIWQMMGTATGSTNTTDFSLVFDDNGYFHETLWSKFHKYKWDRYQNSELVTADLIMNSYDWNQLQINRPILFNKELYSLVSLEGFNPITQRGQIKIIKKL